VERTGQVQESPTWGPVLADTSGSSQALHPGGGLVERRRHPRVAPPAPEIGRRYLGRASLASLPLAASDLVALFVSVLVPWTLASPAALGPDTSLPLLIGLLGVGLVLAKGALRLYPGFGMHGVVELERSVKASTLVFGAFILSDFMNGIGGDFRLLLLAAWALYVVIAPISRSLTRRAVSRFSWWRQPLLVLGSGLDAQRVGDYFASHPSLGFDPVSLSGDDDPTGHSLSYQRVVQDPRVVARLAERHGALCAAVPLNGTDPAGHEFFLEQCKNVFPQLLIIPEPGWLPGYWMNSADHRGTVGLRVGTDLLNPLARAAKRGMDLALTIPMTILALPLFGLIGFAVWITSPGPIFYGSERIGKGRRRFIVLKFRTMCTNADEVLQDHLSRDKFLREEWERTQKLRRDPRITSVGRWLRRLSLDELPQLWNVICGDMSLVGPRPVIPPEVTKREGRDVGLYLSVLPGLTGLWQISGRNDTTYEERIDLDSHYVRNWSPWLDIHILTRTVKVVLTGDGAY
jgi:Undecaprenyl-phosphate galactose phosphotransferase WbaP